MSETAHSVTEVTGDDVVFNLGCSERWASWVVMTADAVDEDDVTQVDVLLKESEDWSALSNAVATIEDQLDGGEPTRLLDHTDLSYRIGFSEQHARALLDDLEAALEFGAGGHKVELQLTYPTMHSLAAQFRGQIE